MSWIDILYPMMGAASLTLGAIHFVVFLKRRRDYDFLLFALIAFAVAASSIFELLSIRTSDPSEFAQLRRYSQVPIAVMLVAMLAYVRVRFRAGNLPLAYSVALLRAVALVIAISSPGSLHYASVSRMVPVELWGGAVVNAPVGTPGPMVWVTYIANLLMVLYLLGATWEVARREHGPPRRSAILVCGGMAFFLAVSATLVALTNRGVVTMPFIVNPVFVVVVLVMTYELGGDLVRGALDSRRLAESEERLYDSEMRVALAAEATGLGLWSWDVGRDRVWVSDNGRVLFDLPPDEPITFARFLGLLHPDDRERVRQDIHRSLVQGDAFQREYRIVMPGGGAKWLVSRGRIKRDESGKAITFFGLSLDVTGERLGDMRFEVAVEASPNAMLLVARDGHIALANARAGHVFGYTPQELVGKPVELLVPDALKSAHRDDRRDFTGHPAARPMAAGRELFGQHRDGHLVPIEIGLNPVETPAGSFVLASIGDISERIRHEREAALQRDELAHLSRVAMLGELSGSLAHELNQPLAAILANAQAALRFIDRPELQQELRETLGDIVENDKRAGDVIRRLRAMLKKEEVKHRRLDLNALVSDVLRLYRSDLLNRKVALVLELAPESPEVDGDPVQVQQVLLNLMMNACDAMEGVREGRTLTIRTRVTGIQSDQVEVSVSDVGKGVAADQLERVFEAFVTSKPEGMGLGLAVCRTIVQAHHGRIWCENNAGRGATFRFELQRAELREAATRAVAPPPPRQPTPPPENRPAGASAA